MKFIQAIVCLLAFSAAVVVNAQTTTPNDWEAVENAMGRTGQAQADGAFKFSLPRRDLTITVSGLQLKAGFALGSWVAFNRPGSDSMAMGDLVLAEPEVQPVMLKLQEGGVQITGLHNHVTGESPRVMYMHIEGHGAATRLAQAIHDAVALTKTPPAAAGESSRIDFDTAQVDQALDRHGKNNNGVYQFGIPRGEDVRENGMTIPPSMGVATAINFQPTGEGKAAITGDFVLIASEVNPVMAALLANGIAVTAVHSHMLEEQPRLFFMHFWANDNATKLARGLRAALDRTNSKK